MAKYSLCTGTMLLVCAFAMNTAGCKSSSFSGEAASAATSSQHSGTAAADYSKVAAPCTQAGSTQAKLLTPTITNADQQNALAYEIFVTDCSGQRKSVDATTIKFDLDAIFDHVAESQPLNYTVTSTDARTSGRLIQVPNSDLFGKTGPGFFHFETDQPFSLATAASSVTLTIQMAGRSFRPFKTATTGNYPQMQTYLSFGDATPVASAVQILGQLPAKGP